MNAAKRCRKPKQGDAKEEEMTSDQTAVTVTCIECGFENPSGFKFCGQCGGPLIEITEEEGEPRAFVEKRLDDLIEIVEDKVQDVIEEVEDEAAKRAEEVLREKVEELTGVDLLEFLTCEVCEMVNPATQLYCLVCGAVVTPIGASCPACGALNPTGTLFCDNCGQRLGITFETREEQ
jgi:uncharacterized Zn finger protein (UPF0148 family)